MFSSLRSHVLLHVAAARVKTHYDSLHERSLAKFNKVPQTKISHSFSPSDYASAMEKLGRVALFYDPERAQSTRGFEGLLDPFAFKQQLQRCFSLHFTPKELGAVVDHFDKDKNGFIDGSEFLVGFYTLSQKVKKQERLKVKKGEI